MTEYDILYIVYFFQEILFFVEACVARKKGGGYLPCKFPFIYQGVTHHRCTQETQVQNNNWHTGYWCATQTSSTWYEDGDYGYCIDKCPMEDSKNK